MAGADRQWQDVLGRRGFTNLPVVSASWGSNWGLVTQMRPHSLLNTVVHRSGFPKATVVLQ